MKEYSPRKVESDYSKLPQNAIRGAYSEWQDTLPMQTFLLEKGSLEIKTLGKALMEAKNLFDLLEIIKPYSKIPLKNGTFTDGETIGVVADMCLNHKKEKGSLFKKDGLVSNLEVFDVDGIHDLKKHILKLIEEERGEAEEINEVFLKPTTSMKTPQGEVDLTVPLDPIKNTTKEELLPQGETLPIDTPTSAHIKQEKRKEEGQSEKIKRGRFSHFTSRLKGWFSRSKKEEDDENDDDFPSTDILYDEPKLKKDTTIDDEPQEPFRDELYDVWVRENAERIKKLELEEESSKKTKKEKNGFSLFGRLKSKKLKPVESSLSKNTVTPDEKINSEELQKVIESRLPDHNEFFNTMTGLYTSAAHGTTEKKHHQEQPIPLEISPDVEQKLNAVDKKTESLRTSLIEKIGMKGETFLSLLDRGSEFFGKNVGWKTKVFASAGLLTAGALSASSGPIVLTAIGLTSLTLRTVSAAGTYLTVRGILEKNYEEREKSGKKVSALEKGLYGAGTIIIAVGVGQAISYLFENIASNIESSLHTAQNVVQPEINPNIATSSPEVLPDTSHATTELGTVAHNTLTPEIILEPTEILHTVTRNENLWSVLRKTLENSDYQGFSHLSRGVQEAKISLLIDQIAKDPSAYGIASGKPDIIHPGEILNLTKLFTK
jgi:hypothetical protein